MAQEKKFNLKKFYNKHPLISNLILMVVVVWLLIWGVLIFLDYWTFHGATAVVPDIKNKSYQLAKAELEANKLTIEIIDSIYEINSRPGTIIESWPKPGAIVKEGRQVYVTITAFSPKQVTISMPLTGNVSARQAMSYLRGIGISDIQVVYVPSEYIDLVVEAKVGNTPLTPGTSIPINSVVTIEVGCVPTMPTNSLDIEEQMPELEL